MQSGRFGKLTNFPQGLQIMNPIDQNFWKGRNVFITGSTGLLGSWVTEFLLNAGANVVGLIRDHVPRSRISQNRLINCMTIVTGEVEDYYLIDRILNEYQIQTVFHLAAQTIVSIANQSPLSTFESNIKGTWNILESCRRTSWVESVLVASSDKAYGEHSQLPYQEDTPLIGRHPYDVSKSCADLLAQAYSISYELPVCITRFGNLYGAGDLNFNRLIPGTIRSIIQNESPVIRSDGKFSRDYIYVEDAGLAYLMLAQAMRTQPSIVGEAFNFSYESPFTVRQVVGKILDVMDRNDLVPVVLGTASNEIPHQYLNSSKARDILGWEASFTFDEGLRKTIQWYQESVEATVTK